MKSCDKGSRGRLDGSELKSDEKYVRCTSCDRQVSIGQLHIYKGQFYCTDCFEKRKKVKDYDRRVAIKTIGVGGILATTYLLGLQKGSGSPVPVRDSWVGIYQPDLFKLPGVYNDPEYPLPGQAWYRIDAGVTAFHDGVQRTNIYSKRANGLVTISPTGIKNGQSAIPNDGADFGPDTLGTTTFGIQEAFDYMVTNRIFSIFLLSGTFQISNTVLLPSGFNGVTVRGAGVLSYNGPNTSNSGTVIQGSGDYTLFEWSDPSVFTQGWMFENLSFSAPTTTVPVVDLHQSEQSTNLLLNHVTVTNTSPFGVTGGNLEDATIVPSCLDMSGNEDSNLFACLFSGYSGNPGVKWVSGGGSISDFQSKFFNGIYVSAVTALFSGSVISGDGTGFNTLYTYTNVEFGTEELDLFGVYFNSSNMMGINAFSPVTSAPFGNKLIINAVGLLYPASTPLVSVNNEFIQVYLHAQGLTAANLINLFNVAPGVLLSAPFYPIVKIDNAVLTPPERKYNISVYAPQLPANPPLSGTVYQNLDPSGVEYKIYLPVYATIPGTAGKVAVALSPTSPPTQLIAKYISESTSSSSTEVIELTVPVLWYYSFTATGATFGTANVLAT